MAAASVAAPASPPVAPEAPRRQFRGVWRWTAIALSAFIVADKAVSRWFAAPGLDCEPGACGDVAARRLEAAGGAVGDENASDGNGSNLSLGDHAADAGHAAAGGHEENGSHNGSAEEHGAEGRGAGGAAHDAHAAEHGAHDEHGGLAMFFLIGAIMLGTVMLHISSWPKFHGMQQTVVLFLLGVVSSFVIVGLDLTDKLGVLGVSHRMWMQIDPHVLLFTLLPPLLAGDAMSIDTQVAEKVALQCLYLAGPGVAIGTALTAGFLKLLIPEWDFYFCAMTGSILGATDPVAVVALLKELGASPTLTVQIQGESLLNDGTAIVVFTVMYNIVGGVEYEIAEVFVLLVRTVVYAVVVGMTIGIMMFLWIKSVHNKTEHNSALIQVSLTVVCAYASFSVAEGLLHISGVLSTVAASLVLAREMWAEVSCDETMHTIWHMFEYLGNTVIFFLAGALTGRSMVNDASWADYGYLVAIYLALVVIRFFMLFASRPLLRLLHKDRQPVAVADAIVMGWGGLRGAVGLALSIQVAVNKAGGKIPDREAHRVLFYVGGVAFLTLLVNATTCPAVVKYLGITQLPKAKQKLMLLVHRRLVERAKASHHCSAVKSEVLKVLDTMRQDIEPEQGKKSGEHVPKCIDDLGMIPSDRADGPTAEVPLERTASWAQSNFNRGVQMVIGGQVGRDTLQKRTIKDLEAAKLAFKTIPEKVKLRLKEVLSPNPLDDQEHDMIRRVREFRSPLSLFRSINEAFLALLRSSYGVQMEQDAISAQVGQILMGSVAHAMSFPGESLSDFEFIQRRFGDIDQERCSRATMRRRMQMKTGTSAELGQRRAALGAHSARRLVFSPYFSILTMIAISLSSIWIFLELKFDDDGEPLFWGVELSFTIFFAFECIVKVFAFGRYYFFEWRNIFDAVMVGLGVTAQILRFTHDEESVTRVLKVLLISRALMIFRLMKLAQDATDQMKPMDEASRQASENIMKFNVLVAFCKAHAEAQQKMLEFFGRKGKADLVEVCLCLLQSQAGVYKAKNMCTHIENELDDWRLQETIVCEKNLKATWELERFVTDAKDMGVLSAREAEEIIETMHHHTRKYQGQIKTIFGGRAVKPMYCQEGESDRPKSEVLSRPPNDEADSAPPPASAPATPVHRVAERPAAAAVTARGSAAGAAQGEGEAAPAKKRLPGEAPRRPGASEKAPPSGERPAQSPHEAEKPRDEKGPAWKTKRGSQKSVRSKR